MLRTLKRGQWVYWNDPKKCCSGNYYVYAWANPLKPNSEVSLYLVGNEEIVYNFVRLSELTNEK